MRLSDIQFVDLYLGKDYCDMTGLAGANEIRAQAPEAIAGELMEVRQECTKHFEEHLDPEFSIRRDGLLYRVTMVSDIDNDEVYILRRAMTEIRPIRQIGLQAHLVEALLARSLRGLVLVVGEMGAGKTTTAASIVKHRLEAHGGIAVAVEDPPETCLNGLHGKGRCIVVKASRRTGGYKEQLTRAMRSGAEMIFIGEIRDPETALQAVQASINGHLIVATLHAGDIVQGIQRIPTLCGNQAGTAQEILSEGLSLVVFQNLERVKGSEGEADVRRMVVKSLILSESAEGIRTKIRKGQIGAIVHDIETQSRLGAWNRDRIS